MGSVFQSCCQFGLQFKREAFLRATGEKMHVAAHGPKEFFRRAECAVFLLGEKSQLYQFAGFSHIEKIFTDPEQGMEIAKTAFSVLDVRFDPVARFAAFLMPCISLFQFRRDKFPRCIGNDFILELFR